MRIVIETDWPAEGRGRNGWFVPHEILVADFTIFHQKDRKGESSEYVNTPSVRIEAASKKMGNHPPIHLNLPAEAAEKLARAILEMAAMARARLHSEGGTSIQ